MEPKEYDLTANEVALLAELDAQIAAAQHRKEGAILTLASIRGIKNAEIKQDGVRLLAIPK